MISACSNKLLDIVTPDLKINSGEEYDYTYVKDKGIYASNTFEKKSVLVLPTKPYPGFSISVNDAFTSWKWYPLVIHRNGENIMGIKENMVCDVENAVFTLTYINPTIGWKIEAGIK